MSDAAGTGLKFSRPFTARNWAEISQPNGAENSNKTAQRFATFERFSARNGRTETGQNSWRSGGNSGKNSGWRLGRFRRKISRPHRAHRNWRFAQGLQTSLRTVGREADFAQFAEAVGGLYRWGGFGATPSDLVRRVGGFGLGAWAGWCSRSVLCSALRPP